MSRAAAARGRNGGGKVRNIGLLRVHVNDDGLVEMRNTQIVGMSGICQTVDEALEYMTDFAGWGFTIVNDDEIIDAVKAHANRQTELYYPTEEEWADMNTDAGMAELEFAI